MEGGTVSIELIETFPKKKWKVTLGKHPVDFEFIGMESTEVMQALGAWIHLQAVLATIPLGEGNNG